LANLITTKQNKLPSFIDRCTIMYFRSLWIIGFIKEWTWFYRRLLFDCSFRSFVEL
jgi:hypothetical protein